jgi:metallo-beta-lactamase class B
MIAERYRARVVASEIDWQMMETGLEFDSKMWDRPPQRDIAVKDGDSLTLGDTTVRFLITPGHTLGTISPVFDVRDGPRVHKAMVWGGTSFNFGRDMRRLDGYIAQTERMRELSARWGIDVPLSNHPGFDGTVAKLKARKDAAGGANPFVSGQPVVDRAMRVLNTCARAQKSRFLLTAQAGHSELFAQANLVDGHAQHNEDEHIQAGMLALSRSEAAKAVAFPFSVLASAHTLDPHKSR